MAEDNVVEVEFDDDDTEESALDIIGLAMEARADADDAFDEAYEDFDETEREYMKLTGDYGPEGGFDKIKGLLSRYGPTAMKYFGAGGVGAGLLLSLSKDGTGSGILSKITGIFGGG